MHTNNRLVKKWINVLFVISPYREDIHAKKNKRTGTFIQHFRVPQYSADPIIKVASVYLINCCLHFS